MKHLELLNPSEVLDTHNNVCPNNDVIDLCQICDVDCGCDTYVCVDTCVDSCIDCTTCNVAVNIITDPCVIDLC